MRKMGKRKISSLEKVSIAIAVALIVIGALWCAISVVSASGMLKAEVKVDNDDEFVSVGYGSTIIGNIKAREVDITMFAGQIVEIEFDTSADVLDALIIDDRGKIIDTHQFSKGSCDIVFPTGTCGIRVIVLLDPGNDKVYGSYDERQEFLDRCENFSVQTKEKTINAILSESIGCASSDDFAMVTKIWIKVVQPKITNVKGEWDDSDDELTLKITADSNLPRRTEIVYTIFGLTDDTTGVDRDGEINFDIGFKKIDFRGACKIEMRVGSWSESFKLDPPPETTQIWVTPEPTLRLMPKSTLKPVPTPKITRVLADPPTPTPETPLCGLCVIAAIAISAIIRRKKITGN